MGVLRVNTFEAASSASLFLRSISSTLKGCLLDAAPQPAFFFLFTSGGGGCASPLILDGGGGGRSSGGGGGANESGGGGGAPRSGGGGGGEGSRSGGETMLEIVVSPMLSSRWPFMLQINEASCQERRPVSVLASFTLARIHSKAEGL